MELFITEASILQMVQCRFSVEDLLIKKKKMMKSKSSFRTPKPVLIFNGSRHLIAIARSLHCVSYLSGINVQAISLACTGTHASACGIYFRHVHSDVLLDFSDLDDLKLQHYDNLCGIERIYHSPQEMMRRKQLHDLRRNQAKNYVPWRKGGADEE